MILLLTIQAKHTKFTHSLNILQCIHGCFSDDVDQSIDELMTKFKGRFSSRQYPQLRPIKQNVVEKLFPDPFLQIQN